MCNIEKSNERVRMVRPYFPRFRFLLSPHADDNLETGLREGMA
jgi:hypothetical protein